MISSTSTFMVVFQPTMLIHFDLYVTGKVKAECRFVEEWETVPLIMKIDFDTVLMR